MKNILKYIKYIFTLSIILSYHILIGQTNTIVFNGRKFNVFPYKLESEFSVNFSYSIYEFDEFSIPFIPDSLIDGEYILFYAYQYHYNDIKQKRKFKNKNNDTFNIAAIFNIKKNKKNGPVAFYSIYNNRNPYVIGYYKNDLKDSIWTTSKIFKNEKISVEYKEGIINGKMLIYDFKKKTMLEKVYKNGIEVNEELPINNRKIKYQGRKVFRCKYSIAENMGQLYNNKDSTLLARWEGIQDLNEKFIDGEYLVYYKPEKKIYDLVSKKMLPKKKKPYIAANFCIKNGKLEGTFYEFEYGKQKISSKNNNKAKTIAKFINGQLVGKKINFDNGKIKSISNWKDGKPHGNQIYYEEQRKYLHKCSYNNGMKDGQEELYKDGKLEKMTMWKDDKKYGPFIDNSEDDYISSGFHFLDGADSILEIKYKNNSSEIYTSSLYPFSEMDTSNIKWYTMKVYPGIKNPTKFNLYTKCQFIDKNGIIYRTEYFYNNCRKIPYVLLNEQGDTLQIAKQFNTSTNPFQSKVFEMTYDNNNKLKYISVYLYNFITFNEMDTKYLGNLITRTSFNSESIVKKFILNRPIKSWDDWLIKEDSTIVINLITNEQEIYEKLKIKNFASYNEISNFNHNGFTINNSNEKRHLRYLQNDTLLVSTTNKFYNQFSLTYHYKTYLKNPTFIDGSDEMGINPFDLNFCERIFPYYSFKITGKNFRKLSFNDSLYTGKIFVNHIFSNNGQLYDNNNNIEIKVKADGIYINKYIPLKLKYPINDRIEPYQLRNFEFNYSNGLLNAEQKCIDTIGNLIYLLNFKNGMSHGKQIFCYDIKLNNKIKTSNKVNCNYESGVLSGPYLLKDSSGNIILSTQYHNGKLNGSYLEYDKIIFKEKKIKQLLKETNFKNGKLDGTLNIFKNGQIYESVNFENGFATGNYMRYGIQTEFDINANLYNMPYEKKYHKIKAKLINGAFKDTVFAYRPDGEKYYIAVMDSDFRHQYFTIIINRYISFSKSKPWIIEYKSQSYFADGMKRKEIEANANKESKFGSFEALDLDPLFDNSKATFTFYFKNGLKSQHGKIINYRKYGNWSYWYENGILLKEIEYIAWKDSVSSLQPNYLGKITTYYPNGKKHMEGLLINQELNFECKDRFEEEMLYTQYFDEQGNNIFNNGNCNVNEYYFNGNKRYQGQLSNGQNSGIWKYYDHYGNLSAIGEYVNGKKHGRWLCGELAGINYFDNVNTIDEALSFLKNNQNTNNIDIEETFYQNGKIMSTSQLRMVK